MNDFDKDGWLIWAVNYTTKDYHSPNFWPGYESRDAAVLHITDGVNSLSTLGTAQSKVSANFLIREEGVYQHVSIFHTAYANGLTYTNGRWIDPEGNRVNPPWPGLKPPINPNFQTISIEREGRPNKALSPTIEVLTTQLLQALAEVFPSFRPYTPLMNLIGHCHIGPKHRANCPGPLVDYQRIANAANAALPDHGEPAIGRWQVRVGTPIRTAPSPTAPAATIGDAPVFLAPGWIVDGTSAAGWLHVTNPASWGFAPLDQFDPSAPGAVVGPPPVVVPVPPSMRFTEDSRLAADGVDATAEQSIAYMQRRRHSPAYSNDDIALIVKILYKLCAIARIRAVFAVALLIKETDNLLSALSQRRDKDGRDLRNGGGIGVYEAKEKATAHYRSGCVYDADVGGYRPACQFATWEHDSCPAIVGRLLAWMRKDTDLDPEQFTLVRKALSYRMLADRHRGSVVTLKQLGKKHNPSGEGWAAPGDSYGAGIATIANAIMQVKQ